MPKQKMLLKGEKKKGKLPKPPPSTADEYLEAGVDLEEAGEKWRGGDAVKSTRFFTRAIACYEEGLARFPTSFDIAYNRARIQYELTQYPKLLAQLPGTLQELLEVALTSSRYALSLKQDNADVLYTTAQILSSIAETNMANSPLSLLEESLELLQRCLVIQEAQIVQHEMPTDMDVSDPDLEEEGGASLTSDTSARVEEQWASIMEPVTSETVLDTVVAQLGVLTLVCGAITDGDKRLLNFVEEYSSPLVKHALPTYAKEASEEAALTARTASALFICALADANFQHERMDAATYFHTTQEAWSFDMTQAAETLVSSAETFIAYNLRVKNSTENQLAASFRWKLLSTAQDTLAKASKLPDVDKLANIYLLRGDVDLLRYQLGNEGHELARKSGAVLLKNAEKFYRGAKGLAEENQLAVEASIKEAVTKALAGDMVGLKEISKEMPMNVVHQQLEESLMEGLISREQGELLW